MPKFDTLQFETPRLRLRACDPADAPSLFRMFSNTKFMEFGPTPPWDTIHEAHAMIDRDRQARESGERLRLGIERTDDATLIGICMLFNFNPACRKAEIGYGLHPESWGFGYMSEALTALLSHGFSELDLNRVEAEIDPANSASSRCLERIGFKKEGHLRESCAVNGILTDSAHYGLLRREWTMRASSPDEGQKPESGACPSLNPGFHFVSSGLRVRSNPFTA